MLCYIHVAYATCVDYKNLGYAEKNVWVDIDGLGPAPAVYVQCEDDSNLVTIKHLYPMRDPYYHYGYTHHYKEPFSWSYGIDYTPNKPTDINLFLSTAKSVSQTVTYT